MKNKLGQRLTVQDIKDMWHDAKHLPGYDCQLDPLQDKAYTVYLERMKEAIDCGAGDEELEAINARDVKLTMWDRVRWELLKYRIPSFIANLAWFFTADPDYSGIRPF